MIANLADVGIAGAAPGEHVRLRRLQVPPLHQVVRACVGDLTPLVDEAAVEQILRQHAQRLCLDDYMPGSTQIAALMLLEFDGDFTAALTMLITLSYRLYTYYSDSHLQLRRDCLVLAELLVADFPLLADHLNSLLFDV